jgi:hypothetical protein
MKNRLFHKNPQPLLKRKKHRNNNHSENLANVNFMNDCFAYNFIFSVLGLSSSSSESNITPENDDSQSRDSISIPNEDISSSETKMNNKTSIDQPTPEEEEDGEIKEDEEEEENNSNQMEIEPPPPLPPPPPVKKTTTKNTIKQNKKPGPSKKRKIEQIKSEPIQEQDDIDNSTLAKRKKR